MNPYSKILSAMAPLLMMGGEIPGLKQTEFERRLSGANIIQLINEYNLIIQKKSKLSRSKRDLVQGRVEWLVAKEKLFKMDDGSVTTAIPITNPKKNDHLPG